MKLAVEEAIKSISEDPYEPSMVFIHPLDALRAGLVKRYPRKYKKQLTTYERKRRS